MKEQEVEINNSILFEFQRYVRGEMTKREEYTFQKNIRKDEYAEAAIEGFTDVPEEDKSIFPTFAEDEEERKTRNRKRLVYSVVASIIILLIATSAYLVIEKKIPVGEFKLFKNLKSGIPPVFPVVTDSTQVAEFEASESMAWMAIPDIRNVPRLPGIVSDSTPIEAIVNSEQTKQADLLSTTNTTDSSGFSNSSKIAPVSGSNLQINSDTAALKRNETGTSDYDSSHQTAIGQTGYTYAQPVNGLKSPSWKPAENNGKVTEDEKKIK